MYVYSFETHKKFGMAENVNYIST